MISLLLNPVYQGNMLIGPGGMRLPRVYYLGQLHRLLRRQQGGFAWNDDIDLALTLQLRQRRPIEKATICSSQITRA